MIIFLSVKKLNCNPTEGLRFDTLALFQLSFFVFLNPDSFLTQIVNSPLADQKSFLFM